MYNNEYDLRCRIHRLEDKLLRSKNCQEQMDLQSALFKLRINLQKLQWNNPSVRAF